MLSIVIQPNGSSGQVRSILITALLFYFIPGISVDVYALGCLAVFVVVFTTGLVQSIRFLKTL